MRGAVAGLALPVAFADVRAASLRFSLELGPQPALRARRLDLGGLELELRILGHSHQVIARAGGEPILRETVACLPVGGDAMPHLARRSAGGLTYAFRSWVEHLDADELSRRAAVLRGGMDADERGVAGCFPGTPDALTALSCRSLGSGAAWETVHLYPQTGELVRTVASLEHA
ncbi:MAG TPA: DUF2617 family protein [Solirubrobacteraceae bacterium]|nr:DUF2617 family protein [Solirubrobacteraceae bacterium]